MEKITGYLVLALGFVIASTVQAEGDPAAGKAKSAVFFGDLHPEATQVRKGLDGLFRNFSCPVDFIRIQIFLEAFFQSVTLRTAGFIWISCTCRCASNFCPLGSRL